MVENEPTSATDLKQAPRTKCGYELCVCVVEPESKYCSDYCRDAAREGEIEIQCDCKHAPCALD